MIRYLLPVVFGLAIALAGSTPVEAHCEVPCGIYADQMRFEMMLEDQATIAKAMEKIRSYESTDKRSAQELNQHVRWVAAKEDHANKIQHVIAQYFMTQRLKPGADDAAQAAYIDQLTKAHAVMVLAMKCKQTVDPANAAALRQAILDFHKAYEKK